MVKNEIVEIIQLKLKEYIESKDIGFYPSNGLLKFVINLREYKIEISHNFMDSFYSIKVENRKYNQLKNIIFLTKSKKFHKDMKKHLKINKMSKKSFTNHIICFIDIILNQLKEYNDLNFFEEIYVPNLRFDGIFL